MEAKTFTTSLHRMQITFPIKYYGNLQYYSNIGGFKSSLIGAQFFFSINIIIPFTSLAKLVKKYIVTPSNAITVFAV